jgi:hypothetical protein
VEGAAKLLSLLSAAGKEVREQLPEGVKAVREQPPEGVKPVKPVKRGYDTQTKLMYPKLKICLPIATK